jgi:cytochrome c oxidase subunit 4
MAEHHREVNYYGIWMWLAILTVLEILAVLLPLGKFVTGVLLVAMALGKAALVALYFMHLKFETKTLGVIVLTPLIICVFLVFMLLPDLGGVEHKTANVPTQGKTSH